MPSSDLPDAAEPRRDGGFSTQPRRGSAGSAGAGRAVLAFDVGGTDIKAAVFDEHGTALGLSRTQTPPAGERMPQRLVARLAELAGELRAQHPHVIPEAAGLVVPGIVDDAAGIGVFSSNLGWRDAPLRALAAQALELPVAFDHDVRSAAWAEHVLGGARAFDDAVVLIIGTGIAGALILGGRPHTAGGYAGEIGHSPIGDWPCPCGATGCLEAIASAGAIARRYAESTGTAVAGAEEVIARAAGGDVDAQRVWDDALDALALAIAQLSAVLAPEAIVIGGGLSRAGAALFGELDLRLRARLSFHRIPQLVRAELSGNAGLLGSALRAREVLEGTDHSR